MDRKQHIGWHSYLPHLLYTCPSVEYANDLWYKPFDLKLESLRWMMIELWWISGSTRGFPDDEGQNGIDRIALEQSDYKSAELQVDPTTQT